MNFSRSVDTLQATTGLLLAPFTLVHLAGHVLVHVEHGVQDNYLLVVRELYQHLEPLGIAVGLVHLTAAGIKHTLPGPSLPRRGERRWLRVAGRTLATLIWSHVYSTRVAALLTWGDSSWMDYSYVSYCYTRFGSVSVFYYALLGCAGLVHSLLGVRLAITRLMSNGKSLYITMARRQQLARRYRIACTLGCTLMASSVLAMSGLYWNREVVMTREFDRLYNTAGSSLKRMLRFSH